ncbi:7TM diverse intracellular signaling domain-containing protein [Microscilla marina]|uniref:Serine/threonine protein kinases n=1 Tax=Microscilla marina ATCC 23134 TaxID=313606 RepID=A1ZJ61_MICM2|nr:7TM diverse intracellular signaling domain-containing protein [Microscilla marina]EAY29597.1 serine/threonine protein kinases [Microscilla marina ATCC 23134]
MPNQKIVFLNLLICVLLFWKGVQAQAPQKITHQQTSVSFNSNTLYFFEDTQGALDFTQVKQRAFVPVKHPGNSFGVSKSVFWFRFHLQNHHPTQKKWLLKVAHPLLDHLTLYYKANEKWQKLSLGDKKNFAQRPIDSRYFVIPLQLNSTKRQTYYLRVQSESTIQVPLTLYIPKAFYKQQSNEQFLYGMYFGILLVMALYNLPIFLSTKDQSYLLYVLFIFATGLFNAALEGYTFQHLWPNQVWWGSVSVIFFGGVSGMCLFWYTSVFLNTRKYAPRLRKMLLGAGVLYGCTSLLSLFSVILSTQVLPLLYVFSLPTILYSAIVCYKRGMVAARFFLLAWTLVVLSVVIYSLSITGLLPSNLFTHHLPEVSLVVAIILLSLALADRYRQYKREKEQVSNRILELQSQTNEYLETKVKERTRELHKKGEEIATQNEELKQQQEEIVAQSEFIAETNVQLKKESKKTKESIQAAQAIQNAILPGRTRLQELFDDHLFVLYQPKDIVSGDFYWVNKVKEQPQVENLLAEAKVHGQEGKFPSTVKPLQYTEATFVAVVDCTGHGIPGAFMSMIGNSLLNEIVNEMQIYETNLILDKLHEKLVGGLNQEEDATMDQGMDVCLCKCEKMLDETTKVTFTGSKRPLYYIKDGKLGELRGDRTPIGGWSFRARKKFNANTLYLNSGDMLYLTTDGYIDLPNRKRKSFGTRRLKVMFEANAHLPVDQQKETFTQVMKEFLLNSEQRDDITIVGLKV